MIERHRSLSLMFVLHQRLIDSPFISITHSNLIIRFARSELCSSFSMFYFFFFICPHTRTNFITPLAFGGPNCTAFREILRGRQASPYFLYKHDQTFSQHTLQRIHRFFVDRAMLPALLFFDEMRRPISSISTWFHPRGPFYFFVVFVSDARNQSHVLRFSGTKRIVPIALSRTIHTYICDISGLGTPTLL